MISSLYMRITSFSLFCFALFATTTLQAQDIYKAFLTGRNEVMPVLTSATGSITATLDGSNLVVAGEFNNLSAPPLDGGVTVSVGFAGQEGAVSFSLSPAMNPDQRSGVFQAGANSFSLSQAQVDLLEDRSLYVNINTGNHPEGEIRGQLTPDALTYFSTNLFGSNEVPAVNSFGNGQLIVELVTASNIVVTGSFSNLGSAFDESIGAHIHLAAAGQNGPVMLPLTVEVGEDGTSGVLRAESNTFEIELTQLLSLGERKLYANIHSINHPGGELRGQFVPAEASAVFRANLSGNHAVPVHASEAAGAAMAEIYGDTLMIVSGTFNDLESPIETVGNRPGLFAGLAGESGGFIFPITTTLEDSGLNGEIEASNNVFLLDNAQRTELYRRGLYVNLATADQMEGALRGQLAPESQIFMHGFMSGTLAVPTSSSKGYGNLLVELNENKMTLSGSYQDIDGSPGSPRLRMGYAGSTGEQLFAVTTVGELMEANDNVFDLTEDQLAALMGRQIYFNLPSSAQSVGELRAQILPEATAYFVSTLSGASQTEFVNTDAYGQAIIEYTNGVSTVTGSFAGLDSDFNLNAGGGAHIYDAYAGSSGEIVQRLNVVLGEDSQSGTFAAEDNNFNLEADDIASLFDRGQYISLVTTDQVNGAIRGQLLPYANAYFTTTLSGSNQLLPIETGASGALKAELRGNELVISGSFNNLMANASEEDASLRIGAAGTVGLELSKLQPELSADTRAGTYRPAQNTFTLTDVEVRNLRQDDLYVNIISPAFASGELRGQLLAEPNYAPEGDSEVLIPTDGEQLVADGDPTGMLRLKWDRPRDESDLYYIVQFSEFDDFRTFENKEIIQGFDSTLLYTLGSLDTFLMNEGLEIGDTLQTHYRFVASDGALSTVGKGNLITLVRGDTQRGTGADLEIFITAPTTPYEQFAEVPYQITVINRGPQNARNIFVSAPLPEGMVFTSATPSLGTYNLFFEWWNIPAMNVGDTAVLDLTLFTLVDNQPITNFVQIIGGQPLDPDSVPDNGVAPDPQEDDEAAFTIFSEPVIRGGVTSDLSLALEVNQNEFTAFSNVAYTLTLTNDGPDSAANIRVGALIPEGMTFTSAVASEGSYRVVTQDWEVPLLRTGESVTLELTLFTLVEGRPLTLFAQIIASDQEDPDSTPANDLDGVPDEDDEVAVTILPEDGIEGGNSADLSLSISIDRQDYEIFTNYVYTFTLTNDGPDGAANIFVDSQLPDSLAFTDKAASVGEWNNFFQYWFLPFIESGATETLELTLFTLSEETPITFFAQVIAVEQDDPDSMPNNNDTGIPVEDDEASLTITPVSNNANEIENRGHVFGSIYPVPTREEINVNVNSSKERSALLSIVNQNGAVVRRRAVDLDFGDNAFRFDVEELPSGMYYIFLTDAKSKLLNWRFVKIE
ncbi:MAG: CHRD domain-containing protein [Bacteroidota bacterium]